jgi:lipid-A-disaccharide synthase-like uncharacterized protein
MEVDSPRLRKGEIVAGVAGLALLVFLFVVQWLASGPDHAVTSTGWSGLPVLRWLVVVTGLAAVALAVTQAMRSAPAIPVTLSVYVTALGALSTLLLIVRLLTTGDGVRAGAFLGLLAAIGVMLGGFLSLRQEGGWMPGPDHPIETVTLRAQGRP